jgi:hypothetical protein
MKRPKDLNECRVPHVPSLHVGHLSFYLFSAKQKPAILSAVKNLKPLLASNCTTSYFPLSDSL